MSKIYFTSDHAGFDLKNALVEHARTLGYDVEDVGPKELNSVDDYPDYVTPFAKKLAEEEGSLGCVVGGSGQGEAMCANRVSGIRAAVFYGERPVTASLESDGGGSQDGYDIVRLARRHNNANVLSIGARFVSAHEADEALRVFLETSFSNESRHVRRLGKF